MNNYYSLIIKALAASLLFHFLFVMYFPIELLSNLPFFDDEFPKNNRPTHGQIHATLIYDSPDNLLKDIDEEKWGDLIKRLEENTGFKEGFIQTLEGMKKNTSVGNSYIQRDRRHEDIVVKDVFPTIHNINKSFEEIMSVAEDQLNEYQDRNEIIAQFRDKHSNVPVDLIVEIQPLNTQKNLGPLNFSAEERQLYFDQTLAVDKKAQLSRFIGKYFQYDPNEGDLPIATRELYSKNLERLLYTFSSDPTYNYLDFYLENLNKEDFLHHALFQASRLQSSKTSTELLFSIERIYEIQQRAWKTYFDFEARLKNIPEDKRNRLRIETLRRVNERYKTVLQDKKIENFSDIEDKYYQRRYEIFEFIIQHARDGYRVQDAMFEQAGLMWKIGKKKNDEKYRQQAIRQWGLLIKEAKRNNFSEGAYNDFSNLVYLKPLDALIAAYLHEPGVVHMSQINSLLTQRHTKRISSKVEREKRILWPN